MRRTLLIVAVVVVGLVGLARCAGCSEECSGARAGSPGCPCSTDQDCSTQLGTVLICGDGVCAEGDPEDVPGVVDCDGDDDCGAGEACGGDGFCAPAPTCQRLTDAVGYVSTVEGGAATGVTLTADDCEHNFQIEAPALNVLVEKIGIDGAMEFALGQPCDQGEWFAAFRVGRLVCGGTTIAIGVSEDGSGPCVGADCDACTRVQSAQGGDFVGVCR